MSDPEYRSFTVEGRSETFRRGTFGYVLLGALEGQMSRLEAVSKIHYAKHGERAVGASAYNTGPSPVTREKYTTCAGCSADWPCATARALGNEPSDP